jgi:hypothetical protein
MLMFAQDEVGCVSDELIEEVAKRVGVTALQVNEVMSYYSMLHRKPLGKSSTNMPAKSWALDTRECPPTGGFRSKKWNAWEPAPGRRPSRSITIFITL